MAKFQMIYAHNQPSLGFVIIEFVTIPVSPHIHDIAAVFQRFYFDSNAILKQ
jgi:hypothetical protein